MGLHTIGQIPKLKGLQGAYMVTLFGTFGAKSVASWQEFGFLENGNPNSSREAKFFSIKYSKFDRKRLIIYFNGLMSSSLKRSLGFDLST